MSLPLRVRHLTLPPSLVHRLLLNLGRTIVVVVVVVIVNESGGKEQDAGFIFGP